MGVTVESIGAHGKRLRRLQSDTLAPMSQADVVAAVAAWACRWRETASPWRQEAAALQEPFPFAMTRVSLDALLESLTPSALWALIDAEDVRDRVGYPLVGHVVAGNTPLLAWTSLLRALLMRSASVVKLPSGPAAHWAHLFRRTLAEVSPVLAAAIHLDAWPGGTTALDAALCENADCVLAYGRDKALHALRALCPPAVAFLGYGHRVSFGLCSAPTATPHALRGFARDILLYDQGGCLSPQVIYVLGEGAETRAVAARLAQALPQVARLYPQAPRTPAATQAVREARLLARMEPHTHLWEDDALRWTVIARPTSAFTASPTHGVVSVQPLPAWESLPEALAPVADYLQGCALTSFTPRPLGEGPGVRDLTKLGVSWVCAPGDLQAPPFAWRQDGKCLLQSLLPPSGGQRNAL